MALSLAAILILGLVFNKFFELIKLPGLLGMLILGIIIGPYALNFIDPEIINISSDLRKIALIIILLRAGFGISRNTLNKVGIPAIKLSFIPGLMEGFAIILVSMWILNFSFVESGILAFIIAAVSPAVVVPLMLKFIKEKKGHDKGIPTMILAGASIDDVFAITIFSLFMGLYGESNLNIPLKIGSIPISIFLGIGIGIAAGFILILLFKKIHMRDTKKVLIIISVAILLTTLEDIFQDWVQIASLLGVMTLSFIILEKLPETAKRLSLKFEKVWVFAEIMLFVLIGAQVNISVALDSGLKGLLIIACGLLARSIGVLISTYKTKNKLNRGEILFCMVSYIPKATVQAAIGAIPLMSGVKNGELILALAVLSIIVTAPLGSIGIKALGNKYLK